MQSVHRAAQAAVEARSEVREAYGGYRSAYDIARQYRDQIVPLRAQIISLGLWVSRHASEVARGDADIDALIDVNRSIMEGLAMPGLAGAGRAASLAGHV